MNQCRKCGAYTGDIVIHTETTFGQGDSTHACYTKCAKCGNTSASETDWGLFEDTTFRKAQANWNAENDPKIRNSDDQGPEK